MATDQEIVDLFARSRKRMDEIRANDLQQTQNLTRAQNLSIYLAALGKDEREVLRPHAIEMMLRGLVGEEVN